MTSGRPGRLGRRRDGGHDVRLNGPGPHGLMAQPGSPLGKNGSGKRALEPGWWACDPWGRGGGADCLVPEGTGCQLCGQLLPPKSGELAVG